MSSRSRGLLARLLAPGALSVVYQPIFELTAQGTRLFGLECLTRGPAGTPVEDAAALFEFVRARHVELTMDRACLSNALRAARELPGACSIAVNVHAVSLGRDPEFPMFLADAADLNAIALSRLIVEIVGQAPAWYARGVANAVEGLRAVGMRVAVDVGARYSGYHAILDCRPDYLKLDRYLVAGLHGDFMRQAVVDSLVRLGSSATARVVAQGVEDMRDLRALRSAGVELVQGDLLSAAAPPERLAERDLADCR